MVRSALLIGSLVAALFALTPGAWAQQHSYDDKIENKDPNFTREIEGDPTGQRDVKTYRIDSEGHRHLVEIKKYGYASVDRYHWCTYPGANGTTVNETWSARGGSYSFGEGTKEVVSTNGDTTVYTWDGKNWKYKSIIVHKDSQGVKIPTRTGTGGPLFRTGEVQLLAYGIGGSGHGTRNEDIPGTGTVATTRTTLVDLPQNPGLTAVTTTVPGTPAKMRNVAPLQGGFGGAGVEARYFVTQNVGLGVEGDWIGGEKSLGVVMGTVTARFPMGSNAPYLFAGGGVQFDGRTQAVGKVGGGIEHRFSPHCGIFADVAWMTSEHENATVCRAGMVMAFGPGEPPASPSYKK